MNRKKTNHTSVLECHKLSLAMGTRKLLSDISLSCCSGQLTVIAGSNGAGKTTLLKTLAGIMEPDSGTACLDAQEIRFLPRLTRAKRISYLPQHGTLSWPLPVHHVVALGRLPHGETPERLTQKGHEAVKQAIDVVGLRGFESRAANALSGGERARALLARVLATEADVVLTDEPVAALDPLHQYLVLDVLRREAHNGTIVITVMHDLTLAARFADQIILLKEGKIFQCGNPQEVLTPFSLSACFGIEAELVTNEGIVSILVKGPSRNVA